MFKYSKLITSLAALAAATACTGSGGSAGKSGVLYSSYPAAPASLRISLTDAPLDGAKSVNVNVSHFELFVRYGGQRYRVRAGQDVGMVDLLTLRDGVLLPIADLNLPSGTLVEKIRIVLNADNNHVIRSDDSRCDMMTPSAQQSGVKILIKNPFAVDSAYLYSMVVDFDAEKSVVVRGGTGTCLLKPVLKLSAASRKPVPSDDDDSGSDDGSGDGSGGDSGTGDDVGGGDDDIANGEEPVTDGEDTNNEEWDGSTDDDDLPLIEDGGIAA